MKRPEITKEIIQQAAEIVAKELNRWAGNDFDEQRLSDDIAAQYSRLDNGYDLAKKLDNYCGYGVDSQMVETLDLMSGEVAGLHRNLCCKWVKDNDIKPPLPIGSKLKHVGIHGKKAGVIKGVSDYFPAAYLVDIGKGDNHSLIVKFEDAQLLKED